MAEFQVYSDCAYCCGTEPDFKSPEGLAKRRQALRRYGLLSKMQLVLGACATVSGGTTIGLAIPNAYYPFVSCFPFISGILLLVGGVLAYKASLINIDEEVPYAVKRYIATHYALNITCCSFCGLAVAFSAWGLAYCYSSYADLAQECTPAKEARIVFSFSDIVLNSLLGVTTIPGCVFFCMYMRTFGMGNYVQRFQQLESEVADLRAQLAVANAHGLSSQGEAPPAYESTATTGNDDVFGGYGVEKAKY